MKLKWMIPGCLCLLAACAAPARQAALQTPAAPSAPEAAPVPPSTVYTFEGVEVFGSRKVPKEKLLEVIGLPAPNTRIDVSKGDFVTLLQESKKRLTETWPFALCNYSVVQYPPTGTMRVTVDLVDEGDEWRMRFSPAPQGNVPDPEGLIAAWQDYSKTVFELQRKGEIPNHGVGTCRAIVCHWGFSHPALASREQKFIEGVPRNFDALVRVLREDSDEARRMGVVMLLAYGPSREQVVEAVIPSVRDPYTGVRNEVLRTLGAAQEGQPRVIIPLERVLEALWFPRSTDRNKAGWALVRIVETEGAARRQQILDTSGEMLVQMAGMQQRIDHEPARKVLTILAGRDLGADEQAWRAWFEQTRTRSAAR
ncbi:MAG: HEAT repeat domain-containing protein [Myxococcaceae bacterium]|nr:HEAT repeat domain-containing protein [Myxococcaceae bacterium]